MFTPEETPEQSPEQSPEVEEPKKRPHSCLRDVVVIFVVIAFLFCMCLPAINNAREAGRRASCICHEKQIGLGLQNYASTFQALPSACYLRAPGSTAPLTGYGYSFLVKILSFMEYDTMYHSLTATTDPFIAAAGTAGQVVANTTIKEFVCPSNNLAIFCNPTARPPQWAITNYVALGASCPMSLAVAWNTSAAPPVPYGVPSSHPDGTIFPAAGSTGARFADIPDGTSHTVCVCETQDPVATAWTVGLDCVMTGMPDKAVQGGTTNPFYAPPGYDGTFGDQSGSALAAAADATGLSWPFVHMDFSPNGKQFTFYQTYGVAPNFSPLPPGQSGPVANMYGPGSAHPGTVSCLFVDGSVQAISKRIDPANWFFLITKNNSDPFNIP